MGGAARLRLMAVALALTGGCTRLNPAFDKGQGGTGTSSTGATRTTSGADAGPTTAGVTTDSAGTSTTMATSDSTTGIDPITSGPAMSTTGHPATTGDGSSSGGAARTLVVYVGDSTTGGIIGDINNPGVPGADERCVAIADTNGIACAATAVAILDHDGVTTWTQLLAKLNVPAQAKIVDHAGNPLAMNAGAFETTLYATIADALLPNGTIEEVVWGLSYVATANADTSCGGWTVPLSSGSGPTASAVATSNWLNPPGEASCDQAHYFLCACQM